MMSLVFATSNSNKLKEVKSALNNFKIISLNDLNFFEEIPETGNSLRANAIIKVKHVYSKTGMNCFADDSGLEIESLNGAPGVYSARYAGNNCNAADNINKVLKDLSGSKNRAAAFKAVFALIINSELICFEGKINGEILNSPQGNRGFGYDPIFKPIGCKKSFAEMTLKEKNKISHRHRALEKMINFLTSHI